jgi:hypothetical protein
MNPPPPLKLGDEFKSSGMVRRSCSRDIRRVTAKPHEHCLVNSGHNTARSALSSFVTIKRHGQIGKHNLVNRFMRGIFHLTMSLDCNKR